MFYSTRNSKISLTASEAILKGLCDDGGLFLPCEIKAVDVTKLFGKSYHEFAYAILRQYLDDFSDKEIREAVDLAYDEKNFPEKVLGLATFGHHSFLELFHGQTLTFKDMALSLLPHLMEMALKKHPEEKEIHILTATSGDTGSAVLASFSKSPKISVSVLYPNNGIAYIQEKQMLAFSSQKERAFALDNSNFDDCQRLVKKLLVEKPYGLNFSSANSINIGRLLPQIVYYYFGYATLVKEGTIKVGDKIDVVVPTGNFGDIFAGYLAKRMSLPINRLVVASNENRILTDFFTTGIYDTKRRFVKTNSPSMDILVSSNLERLLYLVSDSDEIVQGLMSDLREKGRFSIGPVFLKKLQADFSAVSSNEEETLNAIADCYRQDGYMLDPHTAVAYSAMKKCPSLKNHTLVVATASPLKFPVTIMKALKEPEIDEMKALEKTLGLLKEPLPPQLAAELEGRSEKVLVTGESFEKRLSPRKIVDVSVPASSANLGPGFDVCGVALNLHNVFRFEVANDDSLSGFVGKEETENNLVLKAYHYYFEKMSTKNINVKVSLVTSDIPISRGLGSSASCIVAGLLAANYFCNDILSKKDILNLASSLEGHPDNVAPCLFGGFVASIKNERGAIQTMSSPVSEDLGFLLVVPEQELSTSLARSVLPKEYSLADLTYDASRLAQLPKALEKGDIGCLCEVIKDRIHVPYRLPLIKNGSLVEKIACENGLPFTISGAGSSMLVLYSRKDPKGIDKITAELKQKLGKTFLFLRLNVEKDGASIKEVTL